MRRLFTAVVLSVAVPVVGACTKRGTPASRGVELELKGFRVSVPAGWNRSTDGELLKLAGPNGHALIPAKLPGGHRPSVLVQELALDPDAIELMRRATAETCATEIQTPIAATVNAKPGRSTTWDADAFHGCDVEVVDPVGNQASRSFLFTDGKIHIAIVCNRDKRGAPAIDAACEAIAKSVTAKHPYGP